MDRYFSGIQWVHPLELGVSQLYLSQPKLESIKKWFDPNHMDLCNPLPVYDFGNGKLTLTDGHSRAFVAYQFKAKVPIIYDTDTIITSFEGQLLYKNDIEWCQRFNIQTVSDLESRVVDSSKYQQLWIERCDRAYNLLTQTDERKRSQIQQQHADLFLYGANEDLTIYYFENKHGESFEF